MGITEVMSRIVIIGSGNVATHLSIALCNAGNNIEQVYSPTLEHAEELAAKLTSNKNVCKACSNLHDICTDADIYIFSIKDDALPTVAAEVAHAISHPNAIFLHTAGSVPMDVFQGIAGRYGVIYPMQTFSKNRHVSFKNVPCFIEGNSSETTALIRTLAEDISRSVHEVSSEKRKTLHLAAVFACNLTNHCYRLAEKVLEEDELDFSLFLPLIDETARKVHELSPREAQTGPMVRYDRTVMDRQMAMLNDPRVRQIYQLMADSIHEDCK